MTINIFIDSVKASDILANSSLVADQLFLKDLANALKEYPNFNISLNSNIISPSLAMHRCHCISNHKLFIFNPLNHNEYHLSTDIPFINSMTNMFQQQYICSGFELSNRKSVIDILNSL